MKRRLTMLLAIAFTALILTSTAFAIEPRWANVTMLRPDFNVVTSTYACRVEGVSGTTKIDCTLVLYEKKGNTLEELSRLSQVYYGRSHEFSKSYPLSSGKTYVPDVSATVTSNGTAEKVTKSFEETL